MQRHFFFIYRYIPIVLHKNIRRHPYCAQKYLHCSIRINELTQDAYYIFTFAEACILLNDKGAIPNGRHACRSRR